jgi:hypothetical protein
MNHHQPNLLLEEVKEELRGEQMNTDRYEREQAQ